MFVSNKRGEVCQQYFIRWGGKKKGPKTGKVRGIMLCKGDGGSAVEFDPKHGTSAEIDCPGEHCPHYEAKRCFYNTTLSFILPTAPGIGLWQITSKGYHTAKNLNSVLLAFENIGRPFAGLPFVLSVRPQIANPEGVGIVTIYALHLNITTSLDSLASMSPKMLPPAASLEPDRPDDLIDKRVRDAEDAKVSEPEPSEYAEDTEVQKLCEALDYNERQREALFARYAGQRDEFLKALADDLIKKTTGAASGNGEAPKPAPAQPKRFF